MAQYTIRPIVNGSKQFDMGMMTYQQHYGTPYTIPIYTWLLQGGTKNILVDTGEMNPIQSEAREAALGGKIYTFEQGLARFGLKPEDIDVIIHTHLHNDHCENDYKCENAVIYAHELELQHIHNPHPLDIRYLEDFILDVEENGQVRDHDGRPGDRAGHNRTAYARHIRPAACPWPLIRPKARRSLRGFCVIAENFNPSKEVRAMEMEVIPPGTVVNSYQAYDMMLQVRDMADILIPLHEPAYASRRFHSIKKMRPEPHYNQGSGRFFNVSWSVRLFEELGRIRRSLPSPGLLLE